jgi:hypothetical protein
MAKKGKKSYSQLSRAGGGWSLSRRSRGLGANGSSELPKVEPEGGLGLYRSESSSIFSEFLAFSGSTPLKLSQADLTETLGIRVSWIAQAVGLKRGGIEKGPSTFRLRIEHPGTQFAKEKARTRL